ncbi:GNAT family N-acetyltransferase [Paenibacillus aestuarii]|uniref:GNAT family N-acetyltransferase n=1 Tax=Paenibacillus aestuarii TaxID=516965 RepID=A0ABW0KG10_9BACL|nr:GNAT family N-acetyltransferase [Paenibacillus aestuarii]
MISVYNQRFREEVINLILHVQNVENDLNITLEEQPDLLDIEAHYLNIGGQFWVALDNKEKVIGSIGLLNLSNEISVLKKFFVYEHYRGKEHSIGQKLFNVLTEYAKAQGTKTILLDTPSIAKRSHSFYEKNGFIQINKDELPIQYDYPDRKSLLYRLDLA